jgi:aminodeoxyfutalosine deaminase
MHVAESAEEFEMYTQRKGRLFDWLSNVREMSDCGEVTPVEAVRRAGLLRRNFLAVHANYLTASDVRALARAGSSVVHCPSSHLYFGHQRFPFEKLKRAGVNICLGTDSAASMRERKLNMFMEMQQFARAYPNVPHAQILRMATINGARALGLEGMVGQLETKALADLITVEFTGKTSEVFSAVLFTKRVSHVFIRGHELKSVA